MIHTRDYLLGVPALLFSPVFVAMLGARSQVGTVFGRYSLPLFVMLLACAALYVLLFVAAWRQRETLGQFVLLALVGMTFVVTANNAVLALPGLSLLLPLCRLACGVSLVGGQLLRRRAGAAVRGGFVLAAAFLTLLTLSDLSVLVALQLRGESGRTSEATYREAVDVGSLQPSDLAVVGDSFVWGQGVELHDTFAHRLQILRDAGGQPGRVVNLGRIGTATQQYNETLAELPPAPGVQRVVYCLYANDMPAPQRLGQRLRQQTEAVGRSAPTLRVLTDVVVSASTPTPEAYAADVIRNHDPARPGFEARFGALTEDLRDAHALAVERSRLRPVLVLFPLMSHYEPYPLEQAHARLTKLGQELGFATLDMYPVFARELGDGERHWAAPNDPHMDAETHALTARVLHDFLRGLDSSSPSSEQSVDERRSGGSAE